LIIQYLNIQILHVGAIIEWIYGSLAETDRNNIWC